MSIYMVSGLIALNKYFEFRICWSLYLSIILCHINTSLFVHQNGQFPVFGFHEINKCTSSTVSNDKFDIQLLKMKIGLEFEHERYVELSLKIISI